MLVNNLIETQQSAFKYGHNTETVVLQVKIDIKMSTESKAAVLVLLDLSAAFHTTEHDVLFSQLENCLICQAVCLIDLLPT